jgi:aspartate 1-decarboxylase
MQRVIMKSIVRRVIETRADLDFEGSCAIAHGLMCAGNGVRERAAA